MASGNGEVPSHRLVEAQRLGREDVGRAISTARAARSGAYGWLLPGARAAGPGAGLAPPREA